MALRKLGLAAILCATAYGQQPNMEQILDKLNQLQQENQRLNREIDNLRQQVLDLKAAKPATPTDEKLDVLAQRVEDLDTSKVDTSGRFPLRLSGMVLMNSFLYAGHTGGAELPAVAVPTRSQESGGGTFRNTQLAFLYSGSKGILGADLSASLRLDFFGGPLNIQKKLARIRTADVTLNWPTRSLSFAVDKPILSPHDPDSLSQLGIPPFANSGNLWLWQPQLRYEERVKFTESRGCVCEWVFTKLTKLLRLCPLGCGSRPPVPRCRAALSCSTPPQMDGGLRSLQDFTSAVRWWQARASHHMQLR